MSDIVERLRRAHKHDGLSLPDEAADTIESLRAELAKARNAALEEAAKVAEDEDGHFTHWGEDRNTRVSQKTAADAAAAIRALREEE